MRELREEFPSPFIPLQLNPGDALQVDWGGPTVYFRGQKITIYSSESAASSRQIIKAATAFVSALQRFPLPEPDTTDMRTRFHRYIPIAGFISQGMKCCYNILKMACKGSVLSGDGKISKKDAASEDCNMGILLSARRSDVALTMFACGRWAEEAMQDKRDGGTTAEGQNSGTQNRFL